MDAVTLAATKAAVSAGAKQLLKLLPSDQERVNLAATEIENDLLYEVATQLDRLLRLLGISPERLAGLAAAQMTERERLVLYVQLHEQGMKAVTEARRRLMAAAIAGTFRPDLDVEMKSRAARVLGQLEASDIVLLRSLAACTDLTSFIMFLKENRVGRVALQHTGCIPSSDPIKGRIEEVGSAVLRIVETWSDKELG